MKEKIVSVSQNIISWSGRILVLAIIGFIIFNIGRSVYKNWQTNQKIADIEKAIVELEKQNKNLQNLIAYYQTNAFKELEARQKLGYLKPDEKVLIIPELGQNKETQTPTVNSQEEKNQSSQDPNFLKWYHYIFG